MFQIILSLLFILKFYIEGYKYCTLILLFVFLNVGLNLSCHYYFVNNKRNYQIIIQLTTFIKSQQQEKLSNNYSVNNIYQKFLIGVVLQLLQCTGGKKHFQIEQLRAMFKRLGTTGLENEEVTLT